MTEFLHVPAFLLILSLMYRHYYIATHPSNQSEVTHMMSTHLFAPAAFCAALMN